MPFFPVFSNSLSGFCKPFDTSEVAETQNSSSFCSDRAQKSAKLEVRDNC